MTSRKPKLPDSNPDQLVDQINWSTGVYRKPDLPASNGWQATPPHVGQDVVSLMRVFGRPAAVDVIETAKRKKEIFKYFPAGGNRYRLRVTVENDIVVAWEGK